jgi:hypothetical protein
MKKVKTETKDELRPEYDLRALRVRKLSPSRKRFGDVVRLEPESTHYFAIVDGEVANLPTVRSASRGTFSIVNSIKRSTTALRLLVSL